MELKKEQEQDLKFSLWFIASILLHFLIILIILFWYFNTSLQRMFTLKPIKEQPLEIPQEAKKNPVLWKDLKQPAKKEDLQYTLIPGRKAVTEADQQKTTEDKTTPKEDPSTNTAQKTIDQSQQTPPQQIDTQKKQQEQSKSQELQKLETPRKGSDLAWPSVQEKTTKRTIAAPDMSKKTEPAPAKTAQQRHDEIKEKLLRDALFKLAPKNSDQEQPPITTAQASKKTDPSAPTIVKNKITLKDLQLGFSKFMQEGNNDILVQRGNTNQTPDAQALRLITYQQQLGKTIVEAVHVHHQYHLIQHIKGLRPQFTITIDRSGKLKEFTLVSSCGNELFDKILTEAIQAVRLYPALPQHITGDTFSQTWVFLH